MNTIRKGEIACLQFELEAIRRDYIVSKPITEERYDRIIDIDGELKRIQVKYADSSDKQSDNNIVVKLSTVAKPKSFKKNSKYLSKRYTQDEIDAVVAYVPKLDKFLWVDAVEFKNKAAINIRLAPSKNGQTKGCNFVDSFIW